MTLLSFSGYCPKQPGSRNHIISNIYYSLFFIWVRRFCEKADLAEHFQKNREYKPVLVVLGWQIGQIWAFFWKSPASKHIFLKFEYMWIYLTNLQKVGHFLPVWKKVLLKQVCLFFNRYQFRPYLPATIKHSFKNWIYNKNSLELPCATWSSRASFYPIFWGIVNLRNEKATERDSVTRFFPSGFFLESVSPSFWLYH